MQYCSGHNIIIDLRNPRSRRMHPTDPFDAGEIGGACSVNAELLSRQHTGGGLDGGLRSW